MKPRKSCRYKKYLSKEAAYTAAKKTWDEKQLKPYKCTACHGWHLARHKQKRMEHLFELIAKEKRA